MISPGREPGVPRGVNSQAPEGRQKTEMRASFVNARISVAAPRLFFLFLAPYLGLTPQAKYLPRLRRSRSWMESDCRPLSGERGRSCFLSEALYEPRSGER